MKSIYIRCETLEIFATRADGEGLSNAHSIEGHFETELISRLGASLSTLYLSSRVETTEFYVNFPKFNKTLHSWLEFQLTRVFSVKSAPLG